MRPGPHTTCVRRARRGLSSAGSTCRETRKSRRGRAWPVQTGSVASDSLSAMRRGSVETQKTIRPHHREAGHSPGGHSKASRCASTNRPHALGPRAWAAGLSARVSQFLSARAHEPRTPSSQITTSAMSVAGDRRSMGHHEAAALVSKVSARHCMFALSVAAEPTNAARHVRAERRSGAYERGTAGEAALAVGKVARRAVLAVRATLRAKLHAATAAIVVGCSATRSLSCCFTRT